LTRPELREVRHILHSCAQARRHIQINAWNWRSTLEFLDAEKVIDAEAFELMGLHDWGGKADVISLAALWLQLITN
jgi:hypothetical protein